MKKKKGKRQRTGSKKRRKKKRRRKKTELFYLTHICACISFEALALNAPRYVTFDSSLVDL